MLIALLHALIDIAFFIVMMYLYDRRLNEVEERLREFEGKNNGKAESKDESERV